MIHDVNHLPYLYVANKEAGLNIYNVSNVVAPSFVANIPTNLFDTLDVMNLSQNGNFLYLALGNSFTNPQKGGMAIIDVTNPTNPVLTDYYVVAGSTSGGGIVKAEGNYAYLGAMQSGLVILDVSNKNNIQFVSQFIPSINFPPVTSPNSNLYNARGMEVNNGIVYLCYDAGGIRIINCTNPLSPRETGHWCNPVMYSPFNHPKAYNNVVLDGNILYVAVDYCGMEVLNISDTSNITLQGWWNPYNCPNNNWFSSPSHTNEIQFNKDCNQIFLSTGKSDMIVLDVSNPSLPDSCNYYGGGANNLGTWGIGLYQNEIYLSYICSIIPFSSNWTGVKILTYSQCINNIQTTNGEFELKIYPNPTSNETTVFLPANSNYSDLHIYDLLGNKIWDISVAKQNKIVIDCENLAPGMYYISADNQPLSKICISR